MNFVEEGLSPFNIKIGMGSYGSSITHEAISIGGVDTNPQVTNTSNKYLGGHGILYTK